MSQGALPFKYEEQTGQSGMTALGGLPVYLDLAHVMGLSASLDQHLDVRSGGQGWTDSQIAMSLVLLNLAGGDCVDDVRVLEGDEGGSGGWKAAQRRFRRERGLVVDHDHPPALTLSLL